ncbi:MAG: hypothetical protein Q7S26_02345 [bacterium]|nr:hypothetical protein [bacterium]
MEEKNTEGAFRWIVGLLRKHSIPFRIAGGFAASIYGSARPIADIDIGIPDDRFDDLYEDVKEYVTFGPAQYLDREWDLKLMTLMYRGQEIDIDGATTSKFFDRDTNTWIVGTRDLSIHEMREVYGILVPVIPKAALIAYKKKLGRSVDIQDVEALESQQ